MTAVDETQTPSTPSTPPTTSGQTDPVPEAGFAELTEMPGHLLRRCHQIAVSIFIQECKAFALTPLQFIALSALDHHGEMDQNRLGGLTALDRTTIGTVITRLEARRLLTRRRSTTDRRFNAISCTAAGRDLLHRVGPAVEIAQARVLAPLAPQARARFLGDLKRIADGNNLQSRAPQRD